MWCDSCDAVSRESWNQRLLKKAKKRTRNKGQRRTKFPMNLPLNMHVQSVSTSGVGFVMTDNTLDLRSRI